MCHRVRVHRSDEVEDADIFVRVAMRVELAVLKEFVVHQHDRMRNNKPHKGHILGKFMGQESVHPVHLDVAHLPLVLDFIAWYSDGGFRINLLGYVLSSGWAGILFRAQSRQPFGAGRRSMSLTPRF